MRLGDLALVRTKNVSPFEMCIDILCRDDAGFARLSTCPELSLSAVASIYGVPVAECERSAFAPALAIKFTVPRAVSAGSSGDWDIFGAAQAPPLQELVIRD